MRFQVLMGAMVVFEILHHAFYRRFRGAFCLHHHDDCPDYGGSKCLWNVGKVLREQDRRQPSSEKYLCRVFIVGQSTCNLCPCWLSVGLRSFRLTSIVCLGKVVVMIHLRVLLAVRHRAYDKVAINQIWWHVADRFHDCGKEQHFEALQNCK